MKGMIVIDENVCKGCQYCIGACPAHILAVGRHFNKKGFFPVIIKNKDLCTGCAMCAQMCPEIAIKVFREEKR